MSFGDMFLMPAGEAPDEQDDWRRPWTGPPDDDLGVAVHLGAVIGRSDRGAVALSHAIAYPAGVLLELLVQARGLTRSQVSLIFHEQHIFDRDELPDGLLRFGIELPGGGRASNLGATRAQFSEDEPDGPILVPCGGGGGQGGHDRVVMRNAYWLWPLPEPGPIQVGCEWPVVDIPFTTIEIDGAALVAAAAQSTNLWT